MTESSSHKPGRIDLGLSEILSQVTHPPEEPSQPSHHKHETPVAAANTPHESEMHRLLTERRWQEIISRAEREMGEGRGPEWRLWWIRGHLGGLSMPVSLLISPFETSARELSVAPLSPEMRNLLEDTGISIFERLEQVGDREQVLAFKNVLNVYNLAVVNGSLGKDRRTWSLAQEARASRVNLVSAVTLPPTPAPVETKRRSRVVPLMLAAAVAVLCGLIFLFRSSLLSGPTQMASELFIRDTSASEQIFPSIEPRDAVGNLSALFYSIDGQQGDVAPPQPTQVSAATDTKESQVAAVQPQPSKERINTKTPVEGPEFQQGASQDPRRETPRLPSGSDGRNPSASDRTPFDRDSKGTVYRITTRTNVLATPSYVSQVLGRLEPGDQILVDGKVGNWYRVRSRQGKDGYVIATNAERVSGGRREVDLPLPDVNGGIR